MHHSKVTLGAQVQEGSAEVSRGEPLGQDAGGDRYYRLGAANNAGRLFVESAQVFTAI